MTVPAQLGALGLQGQIDAIESGRIYGWAWNPERPAQHIGVDIYYLGEKLASIVADRFRQDLLEYKIDDGRHAFVWDLPAELRQADPSTFAVNFSDSQVPLSRGDAPLKTEGAPVDETGVRARLDRVEGCLQQLSQVLQTVHRGMLASQAIDEARGWETQLSNLQQTAGSVESRLVLCEKAVRDAEGFLLRFDQQLNERVRADEFDRLKQALDQRPTWTVLAAVVSGLLLLEVGLKLI